MPVCLCCVGWEWLGDVLVGLTVVCVPACFVVKDEQGSGPPLIVRLLAALTSSTSNALVPRPVFVTVAVVVFAFLPAFVCACVFVSLHNCVRRDEHSRN